jgi:hypothetical protein
VLFQFSLLVPYHSSSPSIPPPSIKNLRNEIVNDRINNFGQYKSNDEDDINRMISRTRPYSQRQFNQPEISQHEKKNSCEFVPESTLIRYENVLHGVPLFIDENISITNLMIDQGKQLAHLLSALALQVFNISVETMHIFRDINSGKQMLQNSIEF